MALAIIALLFQNCSGTSGFLTGGIEDSVLSSRLSGNGGGYDGKPGYVRYLPDYTCEGRSSFKSKIVQADDKFYLYENFFDHCSDSPQEISAELVQSSPFQKDFITVHDFLFKKYEQVSDQIPDILPEVLCRDHFEQPQIEVITHFNRTDGSAKSQVYRKTGEPDESLASRIFSGHSIEYIFKNSHLVVDLGQGTGRDKRQFAGHFTSTDLKLSKVPVVCVTGGALDTKMWPLRQIVDRPVTGQFLIHPKSHDLYFSSRTDFHANIHQLYRLKNGGGYQNITQDFLGTWGGVFNFYPLGNSDWMAMQGYGPNESRAWMVFNPDQAGSLKKLTFSSQTVLEVARNSQDPMPVALLGANLFGIFVDQLKLNPASSVYEHQQSGFRFYDSKKGETKDVLISRDRSGHVLSTRGSFAISFLRQADDSVVLQKFDFVSRKLQKEIPLPSFSGCELQWQAGNQWSLSKLNLVSGDQTALIEYECDNGSNQIYQISLTDGSVRFIASSKHLAWISDDKNWILLMQRKAFDLQSIAQLSPSYESGSGELYRIQDGFSVPTAIEPHLWSLNQDSNVKYLNSFFSRSGTSPLATQIQGRYIAGFDKGLNPDFFVFDTEKGTERRVCDQVSDQKIHFLSLKNERLFLVTAQTTNKIYNLYEIGMEGSCRLINSFPSQWTQIRSFVPTRLGIGISFRTSLGMDIDDILFVPLNGSSALRLNPDARELIRVFQMEASQDETKIYFFGYTDMKDLKRSSLFEFDLSSAVGP